MMKEKIRKRLMIIQAEIEKLFAERKKILSKQDLTTKEHYEFYHG